MAQCPSCGLANHDGYTYCGFCGELYRDDSPWWNHPENVRLRDKNMMVFGKEKVKLEKLRIKGKLSDSDYHKQINEMLEKYGIHSKLLSKFK